MVSGEASNHVRLVTLMYQETGDKVMEAGTVLYIPGPPPSLSNVTSIFPNLEHNQVRAGACQSLLTVCVPLGFCDHPPPAGHGQ